MPRFPVNLTKISLHFGATAPRGGDNCAGNLRLGVCNPPLSFRGSRVFGCRTDFRYHRRAHPRAQTPKSVVFCDLPKTATGKIQKFLLRDQARGMGPLT